MERKINFEDFAAGALDLLEDKRLVIRLGTCYYTWPALMPFMASLFLFRKSLPLDAIKANFEKIQAQSTDRNSQPADVPGASPATYTSFVSWRQWWRSSANASVTAEGAASSTRSLPPVSPKKGILKFPVATSASTSKSNKSVMMSDVPQSAKFTEKPVVVLEETRRYKKIVRLSSDQLVSFLPLLAESNCCL